MGLEPLTLQGVPLQLRHLVANLRLHCGFRETAGNSEVQFIFLSSFTLIVSYGLSHNYLKYIAGSFRFLEITIVYTLDGLKTDSHNKTI